jgi:hypothetical protein
MATIRRTFVLGLAVLLAAATAVADTVITADDVLIGTVGSADISFLDLKLPQGGTRIMYTRDILEVRMSDSSRVAELAAQLPQVRVTVDSGQPIPPRDVRAHEMLRLRLEHAREVHAKGLPPYGDVVDSLPRDASPAEIIVRCRDMYFVLRACGRNDEVVLRLLHEVNSEADALTRTWTGLWSYCLYGTLGGLPGGCIGLAIGERINPTPPGMDPDGCTIHGGPVGLAVGCAAGPVIAMIVGTSLRTEAQMRQHRSRVNDLIRRVNRAVAIAP